MILIDEGWKALDDEVFAARIRDWLKTLRKRNALVGFATQSRARRARQPHLRRAGRADRDDDLHAQRPRAKAEDYCDGFGLTAHELSLIRSLPAHSRCFLVRQPDAQRGGPARPVGRARSADGPVGPRERGAPARLDPRQRRRRAGALVSGADPLALGRATKRTATSCTLEAAE